MPLDGSNYPPGGGGGGGGGGGDATDDMAAVLFFLRGCEHDDAMVDGIRASEAFEAACRLLVHNMTPERVRLHMDSEMDR